MCHDRPAASSESMIVGTYSTGEGRYGPLPCLSGTHAGTWIGTLVADPPHVVSLALSQPSPLPRPSALLGSSPMKPSMVAATSSRCDPHEPLIAVSNVMS